MLGAALVFERQRNYVLGGSALTIIVINLVFTFAIPGISIGAHLGGLVGGALSRARALPSRPCPRHLRAAGPRRIAGVVAVGIASVAASFWAVAGYL